MLKLRRVRRRLLGFGLGLRFWLGFRLRRICHFGRFALQLRAHRLGFRAVGIDRQDRVQRLDRRRCVAGLVGFFGLGHALAEEGLLGRGQLILGIRVLLRVLVDLAELGDRALEIARLQRLFGLLERVLGLDLLARRRNQRLQLLVCRILFLGRFEDIQRVAEIRRRVREQLLGLGDRLGDFRGRIVHDRRDDGRLGRAGGLAGGKIRADPAADRDDGKDAADRQGQVLA